MPRTVSLPFKEPRRPFLIVSPSCLKQLGSPTMQKSGAASRSAKTSSAYLVPSLPSPSSSLVTSSAMVPLNCGCLIRTHKRPQQNKRRRFSCPECRVRTKSPRLQWVQTAGTSIRPPPAAQRPHVRQREIWEILNRTLPTGFVFPRLISSQIKP